MKSLDVEVTLETPKLQRKSIKLNGKYLFTPFFLSSPQSKIDLELLCEMVDRSSDDNDHISCLGGLCIKLVEFDNVISKREEPYEQITLDRTSIDPAYNYLKSLLRIIDPCMELYRNKYVAPIETYSKLSRTQGYLTTYFKDVLKLEKVKGFNEKFEKLHLRFWRGLFEITVGKDGIERQKIGRFIKWHEAKQIEDMKADLFLPPTPFITFEGRDFLLNKAIEINKDSQELVKGDVATLFNLHSKLFKSKEHILKILEYISENPTKTQFTIFKIWAPEQITKFDLGEYGLRNFEFFLETIRDMRIIEEETKKARIFGLISGGASGNGGGFGYALLGAGFDFFYDSVGNYDYYIPGLVKSQYRGLLNPRTLKPESFENSVYLLEDYGKELLNYHPSKKYRNVRTVYGEEFDRAEWSKDVKRHNINLWNQLVRALIVNMNDVSRFDSEFLDRIQNSAFSALSPVISRTTE